MKKAPSPKTSMTPTTPTFPTLEQTKIVPKRKITNSKISSLSYAKAAKTNIPTNTKEHLNSDLNPTDNTEIITGTHGILKLKPKSLHKINLNSSKTAEDMINCPNIHSKQFNSTPNADTPMDIDEEKKWNSNQKLGNPKQNTSNFNQDFANPKIKWKIIKTRENYKRRIKQHYETLTYPPHLPQSPPPQITPSSTPTPKKTIKK